MATREVTIVQDQRGTQSSCFTWYARRYRFACNLEVKETLMKGLVALCLVVCSSIATGPAQDAPKAEAPAKEPKVVIEGLVRDVACPIQNPEATATHLSMKCLLACAKKGSPLVILSKDGQLYLPISDSMPDIDQRPKLMPFLGKYVQAKGTVYDRKGMHAIVIREMRELKDVHLAVEDP